jgi:hypothetical protein
LIPALSHPSLAQVFSASILGSRSQTQSYAELEDFLRLNNASAVLQHHQHSGMSDAHACANCGKPGLKRCGRCKIVYYCSKECAAACWKEHKTSCHAPEASDVASSACKPNNAAVHAPKCEHCGKPTFYGCSRCKKMRYCSQACIDADYENHIRTCHIPPISGIQNSLPVVGQFTMPSLTQVGNRVQRCNLLQAACDSFV